MFSDRKQVTKQISHGKFQDEISKISVANLDKVQIDIFKTILFQFKT